MNSFAHLFVSPTIVNKHLVPGLTAPNHSIGDSTHLEVDLLRRTHRGFDVDNLNVLPLLLQKRDKEVAGKNNVALQLVLGEVNMTDSDRETKHLLHLELDSVKESVDLLLRIFTVGDDRGELSSSVKTRSHDTRKLLDQSIRSQESIILLSQLTDQLLVLVEIGDLIDVHAGNSLLLANLLMLIVHKDADINVRASGIRKLERTRETLILSRIKLLKSNLKLHSLHEVSLLSLKLLSIDLDLLTSREVKKSVQSLAQNFAVNLATER